MLKFNIRKIKVSQAKAELLTNDG